MVSVDAQIQSTIGAAAQLRGFRLSPRGTDSGGKELYAGAREPDLRRMLSELASLKNQLEKLEGLRWNRTGHRHSTDS